MQVGIIVPQGWTGEYKGWEPAAAWARTLTVARQAEELGFESLWAFDHFHTTPDPTDELTFESFSTLASLAAATERVRLGHIVICTAFRNPALTAKMVSTLDVISGGRMELGIGAGWKREEWLAYGYEFQETKERLAALRDALEVITRMMRPGRASFDGKYARVTGAINLPAPLQQPRVPIMVGGNGRKVTWRLAAEYADELNLDAMPAEELPEAMKVIRQRCEEAGRDPATLRVSCHIWWQQLQDAPSQVDLLASYREAGLSRVMTLVRDAVDSDEALARLAEDARSAGLSLAPAESTAAGAASVPEVAAVGG